MQHLWRKLDGYIGIQWGNLREEGHLEDRGVDGNIKMDNINILTAVFFWNTASHLTEKQTSQVSENISSKTFTWNM